MTFKTPKDLADAGAFILDATSGAAIAGYQFGRCPFIADMEGG